MLDYFDIVLSADEVEYVKLSPDLFIRALIELNLSSQEVIVFEDSPNGIKAAKPAGIFTVAVSNEISAQLDTSQADLILKSLAQLELSSPVSIFL